MRGEVVETNQGNLKKENPQSFMEDEMIIDLFMERSEQAISELSYKYGKLAQSVCENILNNRSDAEECVNDSLFTTWNSIPPTRPDSLKAYFVGVARNKAFDRFRYNTSAKRDSFGDVAIDELEDYLSTNSSVEAECEAEELSAAITEFLGQIKKEDRVMFVCRYYLSDSIQTIAKNMKLKEAVVTVRLFRTKEKLRKYLKKEKLI